MFHRFFHCLVKQDDKIRDVLFSIKNVLFSIKFNYIAAADSRKWDMNAVIVDKERKSGYLDVLRKLLCPRLAIIEHSIKSVQVGISWLWTDIL